MTTVVEILPRLCVGCGAVIEDGDTDFWLGLTAPVDLLGASRLVFTGPRCERCHVQAGGRVQEAA